MIVAAAVVGASRPGSDVVLAHGVGGRQDLPIPFPAALLGAGVTLVVTFVVLAAAWRTPRYDGLTAGRALLRRVSAVADSPLTRWGLRLGGLLAAGWVTGAAVLGPDRGTNPTAGVVFVLLWVGIVPASLLLGPVWRLVNPLRTVHLLVCRAAGTEPGHGLVRYPSWLGYWPAGLGLLAFTWLELVAPDRATLPVLRTWFAAFVAVSLLGSALFGDRWFARADPFEVWSELVGRLSWLGRRADARLVARSPLSGLDTVVAGPGLAFAVCVLLGSTAYDSFSGHPGWQRYLQSSGYPTLTGTAGLLVAVLGVYVAYAAAAGAGGLLAGRPWREMPGAFAHSLVPIAVGYVVAHYLTLFVLEGQHTVILLSDPLGTGANLLGTGGWSVDRAIARRPALVASTQVIAVVTAHVVAVVAAHDRAVRLFARWRALVGQLPLLVLMVCFTVGGLWLLFSA